MPKKHYFNVCPHCGAHLDPGESCDCTAKADETKALIMAAMAKMDLMAIRKLYILANRLLIGGTI